MSATGYATPQLRRDQTRNLLNHSSPAVDRQDSTLDVTPDVEESVDFDDGAGQPKLKGQVWPGMGLFDSASLDQKRKRNQRKNPEVLRTMKRSSEAVQPLYSVWIIDDQEVWVHQRTRNLEELPENWDSDEVGTNFCFVNGLNPKLTRLPNSRSLMKTSRSLLLLAVLQRSIRLARSKLRLKNAMPARPATLVPSPPQTTTRFPCQRTWPVALFQFPRGLWTSSRRLLWARALVPLRFSRLP